MSDAPPPPSVDSRREIGGGRYQLVEVAGRGGMATVWRAWLRGPGQFRRRVAIKHMLPNLADKPLYREMFYEEARIGSVLHDSNVPQVFEFLVEEDDHYLVMDFVDGIDLATYVRYVREVREDRTPWNLIAAVGIGMLRGLAAAHERHDDDGQPEPIVHRDVSPHNVLISAQGPAKLIDFGLALARDRTVEEETDPGLAKGKLPYLSPEVARGEKATPASDQFAAGSVLWEALVGRRLFDGDNRYDIYRRLARADVPSVRSARPDVPKDLAAVIHRALSLDPEDRFPSARDMAKHLGDVLKQSISKEDLYATLARAVAATRSDLGIGQRTQGPTSETPIAEMESGLVELLIERDKKTGLKRLIAAIFDR